MSAFNRAALDPERSAVIEACAGSGKTWLLVSRIVRLLLSGAKPSEILAITFTRKAAQEMARRLSQWLRLLALESDEKVRQFLRERALDNPTEEEILRARMLFELAEPVGITTFHGWFLDILQRSPLDFSSGRAGLIETTSPLIDEAWQRFAGENNSALLQLFSEYGLENTKKLLLNFLGKRAEWWAYTKGQNDPVSFALQNLRAELDVDPCENVAETWLHETLAGDGLWEYVTLLARNTDKDREFASRLQSAMETKNPHVCFEAATGIVLTASGTPRKRAESRAQEERLTSAGQVRLLELHSSLAGSLLAAQEKIIHQGILKFNENALAVGHLLLQHYQFLKRERGVIDFADAEWDVYDLLNHSDHAEYVQCRLDSRYKHVLLDEFQDTNPFQWQILKSWFAASIEAGVRPTVLLVGDPKQSIYRFRRAEARLFDVAARFLEQEFGARHLFQNRTRRNARVIVDTVNRIFSDLPGFTSHEAHHADLVGKVSLLPILENASASPEIQSGFRNPLLEPRIEAQDMKMEGEARQFAETIKGIVGTLPVSDRNGNDRPARYSDIMVLVRSRRGLEVYERALRHQDIPYLSSSRGGLLETLEASDMVALLSFLIMPAADLNLAHVLKSPIFSCSDGDLNILAEGEGSWWGRLKQKKNESPALCRAYDLLAGWGEKADFLPVHDLLDRIYFESDALRRYCGSVPPSMKEGVRANLLAFLALSLNVNAGRYPSLQRFVDELSMMRKLSMDEAPDEGVIGDADDSVRFYTVHGAKGLEAPIVWILGANPLKEKPIEGYDVIVDWPPESLRPAHFSMHTVKEERGAGRARYFEEEARQSAREDRNLLYVAMTRASQYLFVSGVETRLPDTWYRKISAVLPEKGEPLPLMAGKPEEGKKEAAEDFSFCKEIFPVGIRESSSPEAQQGIRLHFLLQHMTPPTMKTESFLKKMLGASSAEYETLVQEAKAIIHSDSLKRFFDPGIYVRAFNELSFMNESGGIGRIDRLVEFEDCVWILDYKSSRQQKHEVQMDEYRRAMQSLFAGKEIRCALVFKGGDWAEI